MSTALADLLQHPERVTEIPEHELPGLLLQLAGLLAALSVRTGLGFPGIRVPETLQEGQDHLLTVPDVAELLNVPTGYAYELARRGGIPTVRFGKYVRVSLCDLRKWAARHHENGLDEGLTLR